MLIQFLLRSPRLMPLLLIACVFCVVAADGEQRDKPGMMAKDSRSGLGGANCPAKRPRLQV